MVGELCGSSTRRGPYRKHHGGVPGALIGLGVGAAMGFGNFFAAGRLGKALKHWRARAKEQRRSSASVECFLGLAYFGLLFWIIASELLGMYITRFIAGVHFQNVKYPCPIDEHT